MRSPSSLRCWRPASWPARRPNHDRPSPGALGIGDRLIPTLGNGGYDARHYTLSLRYPTAERVQTVVGSMTMEAKATKSLSRFNLDFDGQAVSGVRVDGQAAAFSLQNVSSA